MSAQFSLVNRPATRVELSVLRRISPETIPQELLLKFAFVAAAIGGYLGEGVGGLFGGVFGAVFPLLVAGGFVLMSKRSVHQLRRAIADDLKNAEVQVLAVTHAQPQLIYGKHESVEPAFAVELEGGRTLVLVGPWLQDPRTFDGPLARKPRGNGEGYANSLVPPYAFPVDSFEVHRFAQSGIVSRIWLHGDYVAPLNFGSPLTLVSLSGFQSLLLDVPMSGLKAALDARSEASA